MRLLDLFCGAGGAAMGYSRAGFTEIVGVDIKPQKRYPFTFVHGDALEYVAEHGREFDAIHASPPCQAYSRTRLMHPDKPDSYYADLLAPTRDQLVRVGVPWVIENVPGSPIRARLLLCGSMFGIPVMRHRYFESDYLSAAPPFTCDHTGPWLNMYQSGPNRRGTDRQYVDGLGVTWASTREGRESIPPAYTEFIGKQLLRAIAARRTA